VVISAGCNAGIKPEVDTIINWQYFGSIREKRSYFDHLKDYVHAVPVLIDSINQLLLKIVEVLLNVQYIER